MFLDCGEKSKGNPCCIRRTCKQFQSQHQQATMLKSRTFMLWGNNVCTTAPWWRPNQKKIRFFFHTLKQSEILLFAYPSFLWSWGYSAGSATIQQPWGWLLVTTAKGSRVEVRANSQHDNTSDQITCSLFGCFSSEGSINTQVLVWVCTGNVVCTMYSI